MCDLRACICQKHTPTAYHRLSAQLGCRGQENVRNMFRPFQTSAVLNVSPCVRKHHTLLTPRSSKLCFAAANIDAFVPEPLTNPGALVWMMKFEVAPSSFRALSLPSYWCMQSAPVLLLPKMHLRISGQCQDPSHCEP